MFQFESLSAFWQMAGHGPYVWSAYGLSILCMSMLVVAPLRRKRAVLRQIQRQVRREQAVARGPEV